MKLRFSQPALLAYFSLILVSLACNLANRNAQIPTETIPVTTQAVESLKEEIDQAGQDIQSTGQATLLIDEAELTSLVAIELQNQGISTFEDPQIYLRNGQMIVVGSVKQGDATVPVELDLSVSANSDGRPAYQIVSAMIGPLPLPEALYKEYSEQLNTIFASKINPRIDAIFIDKITIADGVMTIQGHTR
jgi:uncharacterized protein YpmS